MHAFSYSAPKTAVEAVALLTEHGSDARILAGGTDLLVQMRTGRRRPAHLVDIKRTPEANEFRLDGSGLTLGSAVPCYKIYNNPELRTAYPALAEVAALIGGTQIQGRASIGGNLCNAAPSADVIPLLIALRTRCRILSSGGYRDVPAEEFCTGPGKNVLADGELLTSLIFPAPVERQGSKYLRFIPRNEMDIAVAGAGVNLRLENGHIAEVHVALASVAPTPLYVREISEALQGQPPTAETLSTAARLASEACRPISDMRGTVEYRRHIAGVLTRRALEAAIEQAQRP